MQQRLRNLLLTTFRAYLEDTDAQNASESQISNCIYLLQNVSHVPDTDDDLGPLYVEISERAPQHLSSLSAHKKQAQQAWVTLLGRPLSKQQRKDILTMISDRVAPWFLKVELLMDFLTDSYDVGGATSLLALSGLFFLIKDKNLDYPSFYTKLYSLLDSDLLHSKHRSRFFRLLETFMSSTHLPAALVASFMKRLARLALHGPPAGIVAVIPWIYNMVKKHPACAFMLHREARHDEARGSLDESGMDDPFEMDENDPMYTGAIDSSLWEIETLQSHYHPQVATLARIISEHFTKISYNLEDFLNHTYDGVGLQPLLLSIQRLTKYRSLRPNSLKRSKGLQWWRRKSRRMYFVSLMAP